MGLGLGEIILILILAFVVVGPDDLPKVARGLAKAVKQMKLLFSDIKDELEIENELQAVQKEMKEAADPGIDLKNPMDELNLIKKELEKTVRHK
jgi:sec-independent protein translocase protein TatB